MKHNTGKLFSYCSNITPDIHTVLLQCWRLFLQV